MIFGFIFYLRCPKWLEYGIAGKSDDRNEIGDESQGFSCLRIIARH